MLRSDLLSSSWYFIVVKNSLEGYLLYMRGLDYSATSVALQLTECPPFIPSELFFYTDCVTVFFLFFSYQNNIIKT